MRAPRTNIPHGAPAPVKSIDISGLFTRYLFLFINKSSGDNGEESSLLELALGCVDRNGVYDSPLLLISQYRCS